MNYDLFASPSAMGQPLGGLAVVARRVVSSIAPIDTSNTPPAEEISSEEVRPEQVRAAVELSDQLMADTNVRLEYAVDDETGDYIVSFVERSTGEVIRQVPPEAIVNMHRRLREVVGMLLDESA